MMANFSGLKGIIHKNMMMYSGTTENVATKQLNRSYLTHKFF